MAKTINTESYLSSIPDTHKALHVYDKAIYLAAKKKIEIGCVKHQTYFWQEAFSHKSGAGCPTCARERAGSTQLKTQEEFLSQSEALGEGYDHSTVVYKIVQLRSK